jgi:hypothetical protein
MKQQQISINLLIIFLIFINSFILLIKHKDLFIKNDDSRSKDVQLSLYCENIPDNVMNKISTGDRQKLGERVLGKVIQMKNIMKYPYRSDDLIISYNFILDLSVSKNLFRYSTLNLFSPIAFETEEYRLDGKLIKFDGGYSN